jgi:hypothetical protein
MYKYSLFALALLPAVTHAQSLQVFITNTIGFLNNTVVPFLIGIGFLFFIINAIRFFVIGSAEQESREKAKNLAIYGVAAFIIIIIFWGAVNLIASSIGLEGGNQLDSDYLQLNSGQNTAPPSGTTPNPAPNAPGAQPPTQPPTQPAPPPVPMFPPSPPGGSGPGSANNGGGPCANGATFGPNGQPCNTTPF